MSSLQEEGVIAGKYRLERLLAQGGMGSVWVAKHLQLGIPVAIKLMSSDYATSAEARERFEREARASAYLRVPNVVQVYDYGVDDACPYIAMELLEGEDLAARLGRFKRLPLAATAAIVRQIEKGLRPAHDIGLVHRDLKPANIFLARQGGEEIVKILDFGIAKATGPLLAGTATRTGTLLGSPYYMSPEQVRRSKKVDHRSDLWSLGVIVYQCLTGRLPFAGEEVGDLLVEICTDPILPPSRIAPDLGPGVDRFIERALMRDPDQRFQSAAELADALAALVDPAAVIAPPPRLAPAGMAAPFAAPTRFAPTDMAAPLAAPLAPLAGPPAPIAAPDAPIAAHGTLAPSGRSVAAPPVTRWTWQGGVVLGAILGLVALGLAGFFLIHPGAPSAPVTAAPAAGSTLAPSPSAPATAALAPTTTLTPTTAPSSTSPPSPESSGEPAASASAKARPDEKRPPAPATPRRAPAKADDPLDHM